MAELDIGHHDYCKNITHSLTYDDFLLKLLIAVIPAGWAVRWVLTDCGCNLKMAHDGHEEWLKISGSWA